MWGKCPQDRLPPLASSSSLSRSLPLPFLLSALRVTSPPNFTLPSAPATPETLPGTLTVTDSLFQQGTARGTSG